MTRLVLAIVALCILVFSAGVVADKLAARIPPRASSSTPASVDNEDHSPLVEELQLTASQRDQMRTIWQGVQAKIQDCYDQAHDLERQRDQDILKMLTPDQKGQFQSIAQNYKSRFDALMRQRQLAFTNAVSQTEKILNDTQRKKYEEIIKDKLGPNALPNGISPAGVQGAGISGKSDPNAALAPGGSAATDRQNR